MPVATTTGGIDQNPLTLNSGVTPIDGEDDRDNISAVTELSKVEADAFCLFRLSKSFINCVLAASVMNVVVFNCWFLFCIAVFKASTCDFSVVDELLI